MKILLPLDLVHPVKPTVDELVRLVPLENAEVLLLYVKEELPAYEKLVEAIGDFQEDWGHQLERRAKAIFEEASALLRPHCPRVSTEIVMGPAALMIETVARDERFEMTALTPGAHGKIESFLLGSVSSNVVKHGPGTVTILRTGKPVEAPLRNIVVGVDGSPQSHWALEQCARQFRTSAADTQVTLIHVVAVADVMKLISPVEYISAMENNLLLEGETFLAEGKRVLAEQGFTRVDCVVKFGDPAKEMIELAQSLPADLVVIGAQGRTAVQHFLLGSVSHRIAMHSPCSTAVVKMDQGHA